VNELIRLGIRQGAEKRGVDEAEDGGVGTNAEGKRQHDDSREPGVLPQLAEGES
jgi:hypothetical protein